MSVAMLTDEQQAAVGRRAEPLLLSAAAGSGKTSVLVERFVAAVREDGIAPARILAITFTERAAGELRARVRARLLELGDRDAARDTEAAVVGTFHGFCARLLRGHPLAVGLDPEFAILDEGLAGRMREMAFAAAVRDFLRLRGPVPLRGRCVIGDGSTGERGEAVDVLAAYGLDRARAMIERVHAELRSRGQRRPRLPSVGGEEDRDGAALRTYALLDELLSAFTLAYERLKSGRGAVDFDDLELLAGELLAEHEDLRAAWRERFELLMVDEFQDTNPRQLGILTALDRGNLFTVGDELQSIYGFRHADVRLFQARRQQLDGLGASLRLTRNFRGRESLLAAVNAAFSERFPDYSPLLAGATGVEGALAQQRPGSAHGARIPTDARSEVEVELLLSDIRGWEEREDLAGAIAAGLPHAQPWRQAEARMLAQRVADLVGAGAARPGEVAVLLRAARDLEVFERALQLQGLRTLAAVGAYWGHQQIADLLGWLRALANPLDELAVYSALASPLGGCSLDCLALLARAAHEQRRGVWQAALSADGGGELADRLTPADRQALASFCRRLAGEREGARTRTIAELIEWALEAGGYRNHVLGLDGAERRLANVHKLMRLARRFEASEGRDLRAFLDHVQYLERASQVEPDAPVDGLEPEAVRLMTVHAAKGLEFPVVCLADLGRQLNVQTPDLLVDGERAGLRLVRLDGAGSSHALDYESLCRERREQEAQEEDRILYVAMTRARERLLLSGAVDFARWPTSGQALAPISWLAPALNAEIPALAGAAGQAVHDLPIGGSAFTVRCQLNTAATVGAVLRWESLGRASRAGEGEDDAHGRRGGEGEQLSLPIEGQPSFAPGGGSSVATVRHRDGPRGANTMELAAAVHDGCSEVSAEGLHDPAERVLAGTLSYTSLSAIERCAYRYYLERVLGLPEQALAPSAASARGGLEPRLRGTLIHSLMESLDFARPGAITPELVGETARGLGMRVGSSERTEIAGLIAAASVAAPAARVAAARHLRREHPFAFAAGPQTPLVTGVVDLLAQEADGGWLILDYKSDRVDADIDLEAFVQEHYVLQRELYALALLRAPVPSVEVIHWFLERPGEWVAVRYQAHERDALQAALAARISRAAQRGFGVSPRPHRGLCLTCPGRAGLCSWSDAETLREIPVQSPAH
jgi:ATP-dependent helicase/nuclease subunit A